MIIQIPHFYNEETKSNKSKRPESQTIHRIKLTTICCNAEDKERKKVQFYYNYVKKMPKKMKCLHETEEPPRHHMLKVKPSQQMEIAAPYLELQQHPDL